MISPKEEPNWSKVAVGMISNTIFHPISYVQVLIQIGHEPFPPKPTRRLFGQPALSLPNVFQYIQYIKRTDGFLGCYRGLVPTLCAHTLRTIAFDKTSECIKFQDEPDEKIDNSELTPEQRRKRYICKLLRDLGSWIVGIIVGHPLDVIMLRMMAQFVGGETKYSGVLSSFVEIYKESGITGYYAGIVPRLIANTSSLILVSTSTYFISEYLIHDPSVRTYASHGLALIAKTITYPFILVSHCMAVNNCGLEAGLPPNMPIFNNWTDCWAHLWLTNQLKRGNALVWRYYTGPQAMIGGRLVPINKTL